MEITSFFNKINEETEMSAQSLLDQRLKLNPEIFVDLNTRYQLEKISNIKFKEERKIKIAIIS